MIGSPVWTRKDSGISPVVGAVIMIPLTIIIIAVILIFGQGMMVESEDPVSAELSYVQTTSGNDLQFQMDSGTPFELNKLKVSFTLKNSADFLQTLNLSAKDMSPGTRFTAGNIDDFKEDPVFLHEMETNQKVYLNYIFFQEATGNLVSSGTIALLGEAP